MTYAAKTGYDYLEIAPFTISNYVTDISAAERQRVKDLAAQTGIEISGIHWVLVKAEGMHMTHTDASIREKTARYFVELVDCCADFGGRSIIVGSPYQRNLMEGVSYEQAWEWATEVFKDSVAHAAERNVVINFEPLAPSETNFVNTHTEAIQFVQQLERPLSLRQSELHCSLQSTSFPTLRHAQPEPIHRRRVLSGDGEPSSANKPP